MYLPNMDPLIRYITVIEQNSYKQWKLPTHRGRLIKVKHSPCEKQSGLPARLRTQQPYRLQQDETAWNEAHLKRMPNQTKWQHKTGTPSPKKRGSSTCARVYAMSKYTYLLSSCPTQKQDDAALQRTLATLVLTIEWKKERCRNHLLSMIPKLASF